MRSALLAALLLAAACGTGRDGQPLAPTTPAPSPAPPPEPPGQPSGIRVVERGQDFIRWEWDPVEGATGYLVNAFPADARSFYPADAITVEAPGFRLDGLDPGSQHTILVRAVRETAGGRAVGPWSALGTGATLKDLSAFFGDPRFDRTFWRQLVFDARDCRGAGFCKGVTRPAVEGRLVRALATTSPDFYIRTHDDDGHATFSRSEIATMRREIPRATHALTGEVFRGRIVEGEQEFQEEGWVEVAEAALDDPDFCGSARVGASAGTISMAKRAPRGCSFRDTFIHEVGHAMGFHHVSDKREVMAHAGDPVFRFSERSMFHTWLAYQLGRWHPYIDDRRGFTTTQGVAPGDFEPPDPEIIVCRPGDF